MAELTIEFNGIQDLRSKIARYHTELKAENLEGPSPGHQKHPVSHIPMTAYLRGALAVAELESLGEIAGLSEKQFLDKRGLAEKSLEQVNKILVLYGYQPLK